LYSKQQREKPAMDKSSVNKSSVNKSSVDKSSVDKPSVDKSSVDKPSVDKPSVVSGFSRTETAAAQKVRLKADTTDRRPAIHHAERKRQQSEQRKREQGAKKIQTKISDLEARIAQHEQAMKEIEAAMSAPGFYDNRDQAQPLIDRHQTLMWELGELMHQWEELSRDLEI
jgi:hypothetical protein